ncbi:hypothetical protein D3C81_1058760 [compost metagenome]
MNREGEVAGRSKVVKRPGAFLTICTMLQKSQANSENFEAKPLPISRKSCNLKVGLAGLSPSFHWKS